MSCLPILLQDNTPALSWNTQRMDIIFWFLLKLASPTCTSAQICTESKIMWLSSSLFIISFNLQFLQFPWKSHGSDDCGGKLIVRSSQNTSTMQATQWNSRDVEDNDRLLQIPAVHAVLSYWTTCVQALRDGRRYTVRQMMWILCKKSLSVKSLAAPK